MIVAFRIAALLCVVFGSLATLLSPRVPEHIQSRLSVSHIDIDAPASIRAFEVADAPNSRFDISMRFRATNIDVYRDLFQTSDFNTGVRLELSPTRVLALIVAAKTPAGYVPYVLSSSVEKNQWHTLRVSASSGSSIKVSLDGNVVVNSVDPTLAFKVSHVLVGSGFTRERPFVGELRDVSVSSDVAEGNTLRGYVALLGIFFCIGGALVLFFRPAPLKPQGE